MGAVLERPRAKGTTVEMGSRALVGADGGVTELDMEAYEAALNAAMSMIPMQRMGQAEEVAGLASYLMSDKAGYVTRQVISINGGML